MRPPGPVPVTRGAECLQCRKPITQFRLAAGIREIWMPVVCSSCGGDSGIPGDAPSLVEPSLPPDPEQLARDRRLRLLNIPHGFEAATLASFDSYGSPILRRKRELAVRYLAVFADLPIQARLIVLQGSAGTGKTHLGIAIGRKLALDHGVGARYAKFPDVVRELRAGVEPGTEPADKEIAVLDRYRTVDLLILDDVQSDSLANLGVVASHLTDVVTARFAAGLPSILISRDQIGGELEMIIGADLAAIVIASKALWWFGTAHEKKTGIA
jgi:hypothetical protein